MAAESIHAQLSKFDYSQQEIADGVTMANNNTHVIQWDSRTKPLDGAKQVRCASIL